MRQLVIAIPYQSQIIIYVIICIIFSQLATGTRSATRLGVRRGREGPMLSPTAARSSLSGPRSLRKSTSHINPRSTPPAFSFRWVQVLCSVAHRIYLNLLRDFGVDSESKLACVSFDVCSNTDSQQIKSKGMFFDRLISNYGPLRF